MVRCPDCNGKAILLRKTFALKVGRRSLTHLETFQLYQCTKCKKEFRLKNE